MLFDNTTKFFDQMGETSSKSEQYYITSCYNFYNQISLFLWYESHLDIPDLLADTMFFIQFDNVCCMMSHKLYALFYLFQLCIVLVLTPISWRRRIMKCWSGLKYSSKKKKSWFFPWPLFLSRVHLNMEILLSMICILMFVCIYSEYDL